MTPVMEAGFKLDKWQRLHELEGNEADHGARTPTPMRRAGAGTPGGMPVARRSTMEPRPRGRGKRRAKRGRGSRGAAKRTRDESEGSMSRSGSAR